MSENDVLWWGNGRKLSLHYVYDITPLILPFYLPRVLVTYQMSNKQLQASTDLFIRQFKWHKIVAVGSVTAICVSTLLSTCPIHHRTWNSYFHLDGGGWGKLSILSFHFPVSNPGGTMAGQVLRETMSTFYQIGVALNKSKTLAQKSLFEGKAET